MSKISIHAPHARSDTIDEDVMQALARFQSTLLMRGATTRTAQAAHLLLFQSTLLMRGATTWVLNHQPLSRLFQSTLLMRGATLENAVDSFCAATFQSTLLMRGATGAVVIKGATINLFQSTLLMRGATCRYTSCFSASRISIHAPHARSDQRTRMTLRMLLYFNPRSSCEERHRLP